MIDALLAQAERDFELAARRREIAQALAADWEYWAPLLAGAAEPQGSSSSQEAAMQPSAQAEAPAPVLEPSTAPQRACIECGEPFMPGRPWAKYCSARCRDRNVTRRTRARKQAQANAAQLVSELGSAPPVPDIEPGERPLFVPDQREDAWITQQLAPPRMPWQERE